MQILSSESALPFKMPAAVFVLMCAEAGQSFAFIELSETSRIFGCKAYLMAQ